MCDGLRRCSSTKSTLSFFFAITFCLWRAGTASRYPFRLDCNTQRTQSRFSTTGLLAKVFSSLLNYWNLVKPVFARNGSRVGNTKEIHNQERWMLWSRSSSSFIISSRCPCPSNIFQKSSSVFCFRPHPHSYHQKHSEAKTCQGMPPSKWILEYDCTYSLKRRPTKIEKKVETGSLGELKVSERIPESCGPSFVAVHNCKTFWQ